MKENKYNSAVISALWPILGFQALGYITLVLAAPISWIWAGWGIAWKVGLSGIILIVVSGIVYAVVKKMIIKELEARAEKLKQEKANDPVESAWAERLKEMQRQMQDRMKKN